jgi:bifunctional DNA-binding transcriptional regulator/antitoxin component of YhaV-PrlF toxin-antitoxin module
MGYVEIKTSSKSQITVPLEVRKHIGLLPGGVLRIKTLDDGTAMIVAKKQGAAGLKGIFGKPDEPINIDKEIEATLVEKHFRNRPPSKTKTQK